eukprot:366119-Chlamydomonas_euryale.AAC.30
MPRQPPGRRPPGQHRWTQLHTTSVVDACPRRQLVTAPGCPCRHAQRCPPTMIRRICAPVGIRTAFSRRGSYTQRAAVTRPHAWPRKRHHAPCTVKCIRCMLYVTQPDRLVCHISSTARRCWLSPGGRPAYGPVPSACHTCR